jgi:hypothetical protein
MGHAPVARAGVSEPRLVVEVPELDERPDVAVHGITDLCVNRQIAVGVVVAVEVCTRRRASGSCMTRRPVPRFHTSIEHRKDSDAIGLLKNGRASSSRPNTVTAESTKV